MAGGEWLLVLWSPPVSPLPQGLACASGSCSMWRSSVSTAQILAEGLCLLSPPADSLCGVIGQSCTPWLKSKPIPGKADEMS